VYNRFQRLGGMVEGTLTEAGESTLINVRETGALRAVSIHERCTMADSIE